MAPPPSIPPAVYLAAGMAYTLAVTPLLLALLLARAVTARVWAAVDRWVFFGGGSRPLPHASATTRDDADTPTAAAVGATAWDAILIGGGSAGCALAAGLLPAAAAAVPPRRVLLIEPGEAVPPPAAAPADWIDAWGGPLDWGFSTAPQAALQGRTLGYPRGKALGGSSAINAKAWVHPTAADVDEWGVPGWGAADLAGVRAALDAAIPLTRADKVVVAAPPGGGGGACDCGNGLLAVATTLRRAAADAGWPLVDDYNGPGGQVGAAYTTYSATAGDASNAYEALLRPALAAHPGVLTILSGWEATRVVLAPAADVADGVGGDAPGGTGGAAAAPDAAVAAVGVALTPTGGAAAAAGGGGAARRVAPMTARVAPGGEVFLCAGALASPVLLMRSGVGAEPAPAPLPHVWSPHVGRHLQDHFLVPVSALARTRHPHRTTSGLDGVLFSRLLSAAPPTCTGDDGRHHAPVRADTQTFFLSPAPLRAQLPHALSSLAASAMAGWPRRLRPSSATIAAATRAVSAAAVHAPALAPLRAAVSDRVFSIASYTLRPTSRGRVSLCPSTGEVIIDPAGLSTAADMDAAVAGVVAGVRLLHTSPAVIADTGGPLLPLLPPVSTADVLSLLPCADGGALPPATAPVLPLGGPPRVRAALESHVRAYGTTAWHALGTCRMGTGGAADAVVDGRLRVNGVARLRVVDLSVAPTMVSGNTNATALTIGARAAALVREEWVARGWVPGG